jgi:4-amino-4-deoxy-L-arabinose transferase-like glycosyltransferase
LSLQESSESRRLAGAGAREFALLGLILLAGLLLRLYQINSAPVDFLSWRDSQTLMVARNFFREGMNLFSPSVDWRDASHFADKGTVGGTELQVVPYITAALYRVFGMSYWVGRVVPIFFSLLGTAYFYFLARRIYGANCAFLSALFLTVSPYYLYCGRLQMPESFAYAMSFAALFYLARWLDSEKAVDMAVAVVFAALTLLGKPQLAIIAAPMAFLVFSRFGLRAFSTPRLYAYVACVFVPVAAYIAYSYLVLIPKAHISFAQSSLLDYGRYLSDPAYYVKVFKAAIGAAVTIPIALLAAGGLFVKQAPDSPDPARFRFALAWLLGSIAFFFLMPGGNITNGYYHLVLAPPASLLAALTLNRFMKTRVLTILGVIVALAASAYCVYSAKGFYTPYYAAARHCGEWIRDNTPKETRILTASSNPATLYFADRIGWTSWREVFGMDLINKTTEQGAEIIAVSDEYFDNAYYDTYKGVRDALYDNFLCVHGEDFVVFSTRNQADLLLPAGGLVQFGSPDSRKYLRGSWGPDQTDVSKAPMVALGPGTRAFVKFNSPTPVSKILIELASVVPGQEIGFEINGEKSARLAIPNAGNRGTVSLECHSEPPKDGAWLIAVEASRQNASAASMLLYSLRVVPSESVK